MEKLLSSFKEAIINDKILDDTVLSDLEAKKNDSYPLLIATTPDLMRAIDYRAPTKGLALVICKSFRNERET